MRRNGHRRQPLDDDEAIISIACECCGTGVEMLAANMRRLSDAAAQHYGGEPGGEQVTVYLDVGDLPEADWSRPVDDEAIALAVVHAMRTDVE